MANSKTHETYETIQFPRSRGIIAKAKKLQSMLEAEADIDGTQIAIYGAVSKALDEAIERRTPEHPAQL